MPADEQFRKLRPSAGPASISLPSFETPSAFARKTVEARL